MLDFIHIFLYENDNASLGFFLMQMASDRFDYLSHSRTVASTVHCATASRPPRPQMQAFLISLTYGFILPLNYFQIVIIDDVQQWKHLHHFRPILIFHFWIFGLVFVSGKINNYDIWLADYCVIKESVSMLLGCFIDSNRVTSNKIRIKCCQRICHFFRNSN